MTITPQQHADAISALIGMGIFQLILGGIALWVIKKA
jgi:hypothetical protein